MNEEQFSYRVTKDRRVLVRWRGRRVKILKGSRAERFIGEAPSMDCPQVQVALAKATGNFKRGNERAVRRGEGSA